jgi:Zn-dependent protease with chaperone function
VTVGVAGLLGWVLGFLVLAAALFYLLLVRSFLPRSLGAWVQQVAPDDAAFWPLAIGGLFFAVALWVAVRMIFGRDTSAAFLGRLGARAPNLADPEEKQLVNVTEEMAIAAAAPAPRVRLFDGAAINAAALGPEAREVTLLVSRRMLDVLDRDETQGVIGHLTASAVNGDLSLSAEMLRLFHVLGLSVTILDLPFSRRARSAFAGLLGLVFRSGAATAGANSEVAAQLTESLQPEGLDPLIRFMQRTMEPEGGGQVRKVVGACLLMPLLPLIMIRLGAAMLYGLLSLFVLGPLVALLLRSRRRLADATAVRLTRNPDGLACALVHLVQDARTLENAGWAEMLFIVGPEAADARRLDRLQQRMRAVRASGADWKGRVDVGRAVANDYAASGDTKTEARRHNFIFGFHPSLNSRIAQLKRMGATKVQWEVRKDYSGWILAAVLILVIGSVVVLAVAGSVHK